MSPTFTVHFELDGRSVSFETNPARRLLDLLRQEAGIYGVREGCGEGECGSCSVFLDGRLVNSCCVPAVNVHGCCVTTIEGFAQTEEFTLISDAYADSGAVQCGFCTPGFIIATAALLKQNPKPTDEEIRTGLSGVLCRCTGYTMIIEAVRRAAEKLQFDQQPPIATLTDKETLIPQTIEDAVKLLSDGYRPVAGGTDLIVRRHALLKSNPLCAGSGRLFSCRQIAGTDRMYTENGRLTVGCRVSLTDIITFPECPPLLREALSSIAAPGIRNAATLVGNICNASPAADSLPALYLLNATIKTSGNSGTREIPLENFITGPGRTLLKSDEFVTSVSCEAGTDNYCWTFRKVGTRAANALSKLNIAALWRNEADTVTDFRLAIGACAPTVIRSNEAEMLIIGSKITEAKKHLPECLSIYSTLIKPINDQRSTAVYRKNTALKLIDHIIQTVAAMTETTNRQSINQPFHTK